MPALGDSQLNDLFLGYGNFDLGQKVFLEMAMHKEHYIYTGRYNTKDFIVSMKHSLSNMESWLKLQWQ